MANKFQIFPDGRAAGSAPVSASDFTTKKYVEDNFISASGGTITGDLTINQNLTVKGTSTFINAEELVVKDKLILVASGSLSRAGANGGGIAVQTASANSATAAEQASARIQYRSDDDHFTASVGFVAPSFTGSLQGSVTGTASYATSASRAASAASATSATTATKLAGSSGSTSVPVYFDGGVPKVVTSINLANITASTGFRGDLAGNATSATSASRATSAASADSATTAATASYNAEAAALRTIITNNSQSWATDNDTKVTSAANHYKTSGMASGSFGGATKVITAITTDTAGHVTAVSSVDSSSLKITSASYAANATTASHTLLADSVKNAADIVVNTASYATDHYKPTTASGSALGSSAARTYIKTISIDKNNHVVSVTTGSETAANTDRYVNTASFASTGSNGANGVKMTLTRAGSDTATVTATVPVATTTAAGVMSGAQVTALNNATALTSSLVASASVAKDAATWIGANSASIAAATANSHTHSNKAVLDGITAAMTASWQTAASNAHTHSNKALLDSLTNAKTASWDSKQAAISDLATIRNNAASGNVAFGWGDHAEAGYVTSSGVTSVAAGTGLSGGTITSTGTISVAAATLGKIESGSNAHAWVSANSASALADTKVTSVANHYKAADQISGSKGGATKVVTGFTLDAAGHVTAATVADSSSLKVTSASYAATATSASRAVSADSATSAASATSASWAISASRAVSAASATSATSATSASYATTAASATSASRATSAASADSATSATTATSASYATSASRAVSAASATTATSATSASYATSASRAVSASRADSAASATSATSASRATSAADSDKLGGVAASEYATKTDIGSDFLPITGGTVTGDLVINQNLTVKGSASYINTEHLNVKDTLVLLASGSTTQAAANGAGIAIQTASATTQAGAEAASARIQYLNSGNKFTSSVAFEAPSFTGSLKGNVTGTASFATSASRADSAASADNATKLNGQAASYYATSTSLGTVSASAANSAKILAASASVWSGMADTASAAYISASQALATSSLAKKEAESASYWKTEASKSAASAATYALAASGSMEDARSYSSQASTSATLTSTYATQASASAQLAAASASSAGTSATTAASAATRANASASNAATSATNAANAATRAGASASIAAGWATSASNSATAAGTSATNAAASASAAHTSKTSAAASASAAATSATNAATSATLAAASASAAHTSKTLAAASASAAATSATTAANWATSASTSATNAATYATRAQASASAAHTSKTVAAASASAAATSATNASSSAVTAAGYATAASASSGTVYQKAQEASASAAAAAGSATTATTQATSATNAATRAAASASAAATSATTATTQATTATNAATRASASASVAKNWSTSASAYATAASTSAALMYKNVGSSRNPVYMSASVGPVACTGYTVTAAQTASWDGKWTYNEATIKAVKVNSASRADSAASATTATSASWSTSASRAVSAASATTATSASWSTSASRAVSAASATTATSASWSTSASRAVSAASATSATSASFAKVAGTASVIRATGNYDRAIIFGMPMTTTASHEAALHVRPESIYYNPSSSVLTIVTGSRRACGVRLRAEAADMVFYVGSGGRNVGFYDNIRDGWALVWSGSDDPTASFGTQEVQADHFKGDLDGNATSASFATNWSDRSYGYGLDANNAQPVFIKTAIGSGSNRMIWGEIVGYSHAGGFPMRSFFQAYWSNGNKSFSYARVVSEGLPATTFTAVVDATGSIGFYVNFNGSSYEKLRAKVYNGNSTVNQISSITAVNDITTLSPAVTASFGRYVSLRTDNYLDLVNGPVLSSPTTSGSGTSGTITLNPGVLTTCGTLTGTTTFALGTALGNSRASIYAGQFSIAGTARTINWPSSVKWVEGNPDTSKLNSTYEFSICNNVGILIRTA